MAINLQRLRPGELCQLLNSTPLGTVISRSMLYRQRERAGLRLGSDGHIDLLRYVAWLAQVRHQAQATPTKAPPASADSAEAVFEIAQMTCVQANFQGHGQKFTRKHALLLAALLTEPTHAQAAQKVGISKKTLYRWLSLPEFQAAYQQVQNLLVESAFSKLQVGASGAAESLVQVACHADRASDRTRASLAVLHLTLRHQGQAALTKTSLHPSKEALGTSGLVQILEQQAQQVADSDLPLAEKTRLLATLTTPLLHAIQQAEIVQRQEALQTVLQNRPEEPPCATHP